LDAGFSDDDPHGDTADANELKDADHCLVVLEQMKEVRKLSDKAEVLCEATLWPFPKYSEMLYRHHHEGETGSIHNINKKA